MSDLRRYQVFVSSTYLDLREARQRVTMTLLESDAFPTGMEIFPATDDDAWTLIKRVIDESDYYLLMIAGKYGSVDEGTGLSYTEMEYDYAVSTKKPVMAFLYSKLGELKADQCEKTDELRGKLDAFRDKVRRAKHVKFWNTTDELAGQVALTYNKFTRQYPAIGWMRADQASSAESLKDLVDARARIEELEQSLRTARTTAPSGTEDFAQGGDKVSIPFYAGAKYRPEGAYSPRSAGGWTSNHVTWDQLFAAIAPKMLQEAEQGQLHKGIEKFLADEFVEELIEIAVKDAADDGFKVAPSDLFSASTTVREDIFNTILVQFMALGLIQRSEQKHGVNDAGTYWSLTPFGETRTVQLRALKKKADVDLAEESESDDDAEPAARKPAAPRRRAAVKKAVAKKAPATKAAASGK